MVSVLIIIVTLVLVFYSLEHPLHTENNMNCSLTLRWLRSMAACFPSYVITFSKFLYVGQQRLIVVSVPRVVPHGGPRSSGQPLLCKDLPEKRYSHSLFFPVQCTIFTGNVRLPILSFIRLWRESPIFLVFFYSFF